MKLSIDFLNRSRRVGCRAAFLALLASVAFILLPGLAAPLSAAPSVDLKRMGRELEALTPELMRKHTVVGAQVVVFDSAAGQSRALSFGHEDPERQIEVAADTRFQASALVRPLTAYLMIAARHADARAAGQSPDSLSATLAQPLEPLADYPLTDASGNPARVSAFQLLTMSAGLPPSRDGLIRPELEAPDAGDYLRERLRLIETPGERIAMAPEGYAYAGQQLAARSGAGSFEQQLQAMLAQRFGLASGLVCVHRDSCAASPRLADGTLHSGEFVFAQADPHVLYPAADSLWTSASNYGRVLRELVGARSTGDRIATAMFAPLQQIDASLGGRAMGFQALRLPAGQHPLSTEETTLYVVEGRQPGFASFAFITADGRGAVILCNSNEQFFLRELVAYLYDRFGLLAKNPAKLDDAARQRAVELEGSYRARLTVPERESWFAFLTDVRVRVARGRIDFGGVFQKEASVHLVPAEPADPDLYLARGAVAMNGWRVRVRRDSVGDVVGLDSDLVRYEQVHPLASAWAILMYLGTLTSAPVLLFMLFLIRRRSTGAASVEL